MLALPRPAATWRGGLRVSASAIRGSNQRADGDAASRPVPRRQVLPRSARASAAAQRRAGGGGGLGNGSCSFRFLQLAFEAVASRRRWRWGLETRCRSRGVIRAGLAAFISRTPDTAGVVGGRRPAGRTGGIGDLASPRQHYREWKKRLVQIGGSQCLLCLTSACRRYGATYLGDPSVR
jgi:hypothetical protein